MTNRSATPQPEDILALIAEEIGVKPARLVPSADLETDLGVTGDDIEELFLALGDRFGVDWTGFEFHRYFSEEGTFLWPFREWRFRRQYGPKKPFLIAHLVHVCTTGRWEPPA